MKISDIRLTTASSEKDRMQGIVGYVSFVIDGALNVDSVVVRRRADGGRTLSFPSRTDSSGRLHPIVRPLDDATRKHVESAVFEALGLKEETKQ